MVACEVVCRRWSDGVVMSWYATPSDREAAAVRALGEHWARMQEENRVRGEVEAERLRVMWAGIEVGDYVELSLEAHVTRGGLLLADELGDVKVKQVQVVEIIGDRALIKTTQPWGPMLEWVGRDELGAVVKPGLVVQASRPAAKYWEEG